MKTTRKNNNKKNIYRNKTSKIHKKSKKWITAFDVASSEYSKTGSFVKSRNKFRVQALKNARRLFGFTT